MRWSRTAALRSSHPSEEIHICIQCGAKYTPAGQRKEDIFPAQDMERFCGEECETDAYQGMTPAQSFDKQWRRYLNNGGNRSALKHRDRWLNYSNHYTKAAEVSKGRVQY